MTVPPVLSLLKVNFSIIVLYFATKALSGTLTNALANIPAKMFYGALHYVPESLIIKDAVLAAFEPQAVRHYCKR